MKIIEVLTLVSFCGLLLGCKETDPIFKQDQEVTYKVPAFYALVCTGNGKIEDLVRYSKGYAYKIYTESSKDKFCPLLIVEESDIEELKPSHDR